MSRLSKKLTDTDRRRVAMAFEEMFSKEDTSMGRIKTKIMHEVADLFSISITTVRNCVVEYENPHQEVDKIAATPSTSTGSVSPTTSSQAKINDNDNADNNSDINTNGDCITTSTTDKADDRRMSFQLQSERPSSRQDHSNRLGKRNKSKKHASSEISSSTSDEISEARRRNKLSARQQLEMFKLWSRKLADPHRTQKKTRLLELMADKYDITRQRALKYIRNLETQNLLDIV